MLKPSGKAIFCEALRGNPVLGIVRTLLRIITRSINRTGGTPLTAADIDASFEQAAKVETYPVNILGMAKKMLGSGNRFSVHLLAFFKCVDEWLVKSALLRRLCGEVVIVVTK